MPPNGRGRLYLPVKVPGKRRICSVSGSRGWARPGEPCSCHENLVEQVRLVVEVKGSIGGVADHRPAQVRKRRVVRGDDALALAGAERVSDSGVAWAAWLSKLGWAFLHRPCDDVATRDVR